MNTEILIFIFGIVFSDAPTIVTGAATMDQCNIMRSNVEPELLKSGKLVALTKCEPVLMRRPPKS